MFNAENGLQLVSVPFSFHMEEGQWETQNKRLQRSLFFDQVIAPAGFWPRGQNPRRHPRIPRVYTYKEFQNVRK